MKAIILAGGLGTRLQGVVQDVPKPMAPVDGKPFLEYLILQLKKWGITEIVMSVGFKQEVVKSYFGTGSAFGVAIVYSEEDQPLGTGGALRKAISAIEDPCCIAMNGDSFFNVDIRNLIQFHASRPALITMSLAQVKSGKRYGNVAIDEHGMILNYQQEGSEAPSLINGGVYMMHRDVLNYIPDGKISLEARVLPLLKKDQRLFGKIFDAFFLDMGIPDDYFWISRHPEYLSPMQLSEQPHK
jgi:D-glycero-alpha-D-manno-heptose 1-phosphate guanylyltransferase